MIAIILEVIKYLLLFIGCIAVAFLFICFGYIEGKKAKEEEKKLDDNSIYSAIHRATSRFGKLGPEIEDDIIYEINRLSLNDNNKENKINE